MTINITNQPGGVIQNIDKPVVNIFGKVDGEDYKVVQQLLREEDDSAADAIKANRKENTVGQESERMNADPLRIFFPNREDYEYVLEWAPLCKTPKNIYNNIVLPLKRKGHDISITTNVPFLKALIPHLTNYSSSKNAESISRALRK